MNMNNWTKWALTAAILIIVGAIIARYGMVAETPEKRDLMKLSMGAMLAQVGVLIVVFLLFFWIQQSLLRDSKQ